MTQERETSEILFSVLLFLWSVCEIKKRRNARQLTHNKTRRPTPLTLTPSTSDTRTHSLSLSTPWIPVLTIERSYYIPSSYRTCSLIELVLSSYRTCSLIELVGTILLGESFLISSIVANKLSFP